MAKRAFVSFFFYPTRPENGSKSLFFLLLPRFERQIKEARGGKTRRGLYLSACTYTLEAKELFRCAWNTYELENGLEELKKNCLLIIFFGTFFISLVLYFQQKIRF